MKPTYRSTEAARDAAHMGQSSSVLCACRCPAGDHDGDDFSLGVCIACRRAGRSCEKFTPMTDVQLQTFRYDRAKVLSEQLHRRGYKSEDLNVYHERLWADMVELAAITGVPLDLETRGMAIVLLRANEAHEERCSSGDVPQDETEPEEQP